MSSISRGKLKLKKPIVPSETNKSKVQKKDKKDRHKKKEKHKREKKERVEKETPTEESKNEWEALGIDQSLARMTPAERAYELAQRERVRLYLRLLSLRLTCFQKRKRLEKMVELSHEEKLLKFNTYLSSLSEHYDIPKVGPG